MRKTLKSIIAFLLLAFSLESCKQFECNSSKAYPSLGLYKVMKKQRGKRVMYDTLDFISIIETDLGDLYVSNLEIWEEDHGNEIIVTHKREGVIIKDDVLYNVNQYAGTYDTVTNSMAKFSFKDGDTTWADKSYKDNYGWSNIPDKYIVSHCQGSYPDTVINGIAFSDLQIIKVDQYEKVENKMVAEPFHIIFLYSKYFGIIEEKLVYPAEDGRTFIAYQIIEARLP